MLPLIALGLVLVYAIAKKSERAPTHAEGDAAPTTPGEGGGRKAEGGGASAGLTGGGGEQGLLAFILSGGQPAPQPSVAAARWYVIGPDGALVTTPYGKSALSMALGQYNAVPAWDREIAGGASHKAYARDPRRDAEIETASNAVRKLQQMGAQIVFWRTQLDEIAAGAPPETLSYLSTTDLAGLRAQPWVPSVDGADLHADQVLFA
jgi:hypothetical protein